MIRRLQDVCVALLVLFAPLCLFRFFHDINQAAAMALVPLAALLLTGEWTLEAAMIQARWRAALKGTSRLLRLFKGNVMAFIRALVMTFVSIPILAGQINILGNAEIIVLMALSTFAGSFFLFLQSKLTKDFNKPFTNSYSAFLGTWAVAVAFVPVLAFLTAVEVHSGDVFKFGFWEWVSGGGDSGLSPHGGFVSVALNYINAYEAAKLWVVAKLHLFAVTGSWIPKLAVAVYCLDAALVGFVFARSSIALTVYFEYLHVGNEVPGIHTAREKNLDAADKVRKERRGSLWRALIVLVLLMSISVLAAVFYLVGKQEAYDLPRQGLELGLRGASDGAKTKLTPFVDRQLRVAYAPVYDAIPAYARYHFSSSENPDELPKASGVDMDQSLANRLIHGFKPRLTQTLLELDHLYSQLHLTALDEQIDRAMPDEKRGLPRGLLTLAVREIAGEFVARTHPLYSEDAGIIENVDPKDLSASIMTNLATGITMKAEDNGYPIGTGVYAVGVGGRLLVCPTDPIERQVCIGKSWVLDPPIVPISKLLNGNDFASAMRQAINEDVKGRKERILSAVEEKSVRLGKAAEEIVTRADETKGWRFLGIGERAEIERAKRDGFWVKATRWVVFWD